MERHIVVPLDDFGQPGKSVTLQNPAVTFSWKRVKQMREEAKSSEDGGIKLLRDLVVSYDALDVDGNPLPSLTENPDAIEDLGLGILLHLVGVATGALDSSIPKGLRTQSATT